MSKYADIEQIKEVIRTEWCKYMPSDLDINLSFVLGKIAEVPTIEVSEEDELKFYYVESIDDYWIGQRLDNFYYAEWCGNYFVWTHSRYLPWGEHVVNKDTLWKEHTYPSEPREIPFTEWIVGFMKKYGSEVSDDCISREWLINRFKDIVEHYEMRIKRIERYGKKISYDPSEQIGYWKDEIAICKHFIREIEDAPSVVPKLDK